MCKKVCKFSHFYRFSHIRGKASTKDLKWPVEIFGRHHIVIAASENAVTKAEVGHRCGSSEAVKVLPQRPAAMGETHKKPFGFDVERRVGRTGIVSLLPWRRSRKATVEEPKPIPARLAAIVLTRPEERIRSGEIESVVSGHRRHG